MQGIAIGDPTNPFLVDCNPYTILDTGTTHLFIPPQLFDILL
jgi:hypothetical protein